MTGTEPAGPAQAAADDSADATSSTQPTLGPGPDSELTWLLHRAAQRMRAGTGAAAERYGLTLRQHIVLSALHLSPGMTQVELGRAVGMDKTTLTGELDRLERRDLVVRTVDPHDRRARALTVTDQGEELRQQVSAETERAERAALGALSEGDVARLRRMLYDLIDGAQDQGSCL